MNSPIPLAYSVNLVTSGIMKVKPNKGRGWGREMKMKTQEESKDFFRKRERLSYKWRWHQLKKLQ